MGKANKQISKKGEMGKAERSLSLLRNMERYKGGGGGYIHLDIDNLIIIIIDTWTT